ncbi:MAG: HAD family hydrolase [Promethearchaeota archaeon]
MSFDLWQTLIEDNFQFLARSQILQKFLENRGITLPLDQVKETYLAKCAGYEEYVTEAHNYRHIPFQERFLRFFDNFNISITEVEMQSFSAQFNQAFLQNPPKVYPGVVDVLPRIAQKYKLIIISDTGFIYGTTMRKLLESYGILQFFDKSYFSDETEVYKPHPKPFNLAKSYFGYENAEFVHVGDRIETDVIGANQQGWMSILVKYDFLDPQLHAPSENSNLVPKIQQPTGIIKHLTELESLLEQI